MDGLRLPKPRAGTADEAEPDTISGAVRAIQAPYVKGDFQKQGPAASGLDVL